MPLRLIGFILIFGIFLVFVALNLGNTCDINLGIITFTDVPVFFTVLCSFALGMLCTLPFLFKSSTKRKNKPAAEHTDGIAVAEKQKPKKGWGKKKEAAAEGQKPVPEESSFSDGGPFGVN